MNQADCKGKALSLAKEAQSARAGSYEEAYYLGAAQVYATLATIPDPPSHGLGPL